MCSNSPSASRVMPDLRSDTWANKTKTYNANNNTAGRTHGEAEILDRLIRPGVPADLPDKRVLGGGLRAILMLHLRLEGNRPVPPQLGHRLTFAIVGADGTRREETPCTRRSRPQ